jgi:hypothetical protein
MACGGYSTCGSSLARPALLDASGIVAAFPLPIMFARRLPPFADFLHRLVAAGSAALVLALMIFAASPRLHDDLHAATDVAHGEDCAVAMFAAGVALPFAPLAALPPLAAWRPQTPAVAGEIFLASPRYLRQPERGPPTLG